VAQGFNNNMLSSVIVCWSMIIYIPAQPAAEFILFFLADRFTLFGFPRLTTAANE
jgi:hypothetical protein